MKTKSILLILTLLSLFAGCSQQPAPSATQPPQTQSNPSKSNATPDTVTTASIVNEAAAFEKAIGRNGTWLIAITKDLAIDKELVLDGEYKNGKKDASGKDIIQRKIALYAQDENRNITARYTLTAPKLTINSPEASIQHGTYKGDVYVSSNNFQLVDAKIDGNVYFTTDAAKTTFKADNKSTITGKQELKK